MVYLVRYRGAGCWLAKEGDGQWCCAEPLPPRASISSPPLTLCLLSLQMSSCRFCFFTVFGTTDDRSTNGPRPGGYKNFVWLKHLTKNKEICDLFFALRCRKWHSQTWKVAANTWNTFGMLTQRYVGYDVVLQSIFCPLPCIGFEPLVERFSPLAFVNDISTQLSIYTFTARLLLWQVVIQKVICGTLCARLYESNGCVLQLAQRWFGSYTVPAFCKHLKAVRAH